MGFDDTGKVFSRFLYLHGRDNFTDKVVHSFTIWVLLFFTVLLTSKMMFGQLISCQTQPEDPNSWVDYYHNFCYYQDKYRINTSLKNKTRISGNGRGFSLLLEVDDDDGFDTETVTYYQWIPYALLCQVVMCLVPAMLWKFVGLRCFHGSDFDAILRSFISKMPGEQEVETVRWFDKEVLKKTACDIHKLLNLKKTDRFGMHSTMVTYVVMKWISFFSILAQFWLMSKMYSNGAFLWGVHVTYNLIHDNDYNDATSGVFPRIVKCDVMKIEMGRNIHKRNLYCLLTQNFINEKAFLFLYWWYLFTIIVSFCSAVRFTCLLFFPTYQRYTTKSLLPTQEYFLETTGEWLRSFNTVENDSLEFFIDYLGCDGYLLLQLICDMVHLMPVRQLSTELWCRIIVQNNNLERDHLEDRMLRLSASAPPADREDGRGDYRRYLAGSEKSKKRGGKQFKNDLKDLKKRLADKDLMEEQHFDKKPLLSNDQSPSSSKESLPQYDEKLSKVFKKNEEGSNEESD